GPIYAEVRGLLLVYGILTTLLLIDDLFMVHESILLHFGRSQKLTLLVQGLLAGWMVCRYYRSILQSRWSLLVAAAVFFAGSLVVDFDYVILSDRYHHLFEDGSKLIGIISWAGYGIVTAAAAIRSAMIHPPRSTVRVIDAHSDEQGQPAVSISYGITARAMIGLFRRLQRYTQRAYSPMILISTRLGRRPSNSP